MDINGISDPLEMCKNIISAQILIKKPIRNFIKCCRKTGSRSTIPTLKCTFPLVTTLGSTVQKQIVHI